MTGSISVSAASRIGLRLTMPTNMSGQNFPSPGMYARCLACPPNLSMSACCVSGSKPSPGRNVFTIVTPMATDIVVVTRK